MNALVAESLDIIDWKPFANENILILFAYLVLFKHYFMCQETVLMLMALEA